MAARGVFGVLADAVAVSERVVVREGVAGLPKHAAERGKKKRHQETHEQKNAGREGRAAGSEEKAPAGEGVEADCKKPG